LICVLALIISAVFAAQWPCSQTDYMWSAIATGPNGTTYLYELNPWARAIVAEYSFEGFTAIGKFDALDGQFAAISGSNKVSLVDIEDGQQTDVSYSPSSISLVGTAAFLIDSTEAIISIGGSAPAFCDLTPVLRVDLSTQQSSLLGCIPTDDFEPGVIALDEVSNILYYATDSVLNVLNLNTSKSIQQLPYSKVNNVFVNSPQPQQIFFTQKTLLYAYSLPNSNPTLVFDFQKAFTSSPNSFIVSGGTFDGASGLFNLAYYDAPTQTTYLLIFDVSSIKVVTKYSAAQPGLLYSNKVRMGWYCNQLSSP